MSKLSLDIYRKKRDFSKTTEPSGSRKKSRTKLPIFVVQKHAATNLHYDVRIEINDVLVSWAVPKGPPKTIGEKHLAIRTENHPLEYATFEGIIPEGNYGAGKVKIWDSGTCQSIKYHHGKLLSLSESLKKGSLEVRMYGKKLKGSYAFIKTHLPGKQEQWLMIKIHTKKRS